MGWRNAIASGLLVLPATVYAQSACQIKDTAVFEPQGKTIALVSSANSENDIIVFRSKLRVNTDGAPNSYHPEDLNGSTQAINNIANGVGVRNEEDGKSVSYAELIKVFEEFRDNNWEVPEGYRINWRNVLAARKVAGRTIPCVFQSGEHKGYFGSLTALKNGLSGDKAGECEVANQLDERFVPALVMAGGKNPLKHFQAIVGDLVLALNPANNAVTAAVIGDTGPDDNLGEGSVALNMALLKRDKQPTNYKEAKQLDTGKQIIAVAIIPGSRAYKLQRPYSAENIKTRVTEWAAEQGYGSFANFAAFILKCSEQL